MVPGVPAGIETWALLSALWALAGMTFLVVRTFSYARKPYLAEASGSAAGGILYAFGPGMSPTAKESVREHLPTYFAGIGYHLGIFVALATFLLVVSGIGVPAPIRWPAGALLGAGFAAGLFLMARRAADRGLRALSLPDDYVANILTDLLVLSALVFVFDPAAAPVFLGVAIPFFIYLPLGKVRHCIFFFVSRTLFGALYGRRNAFPPGGH